MKIVVVSKSRTAACVAEAYSFAEYLCVLGVAKPRRESRSGSPGKQ